LYVSNKSNMPEPAEQISSNLVIEYFYQGIIRHYLLYVLLSLIYN